MNVVVTGGAGFIGSNLVDRLIAAKHTVTVIDNLSGGRRSFVAHHEGSPRFRFLKLDVRDHARFKQALPTRTDAVFHLAANADIARGVEDPTLDWEHSLVATFSLLRAMRARGITKLVYTSGSGVYGDRGRAYSSESYGPLMPVSMYGAAKLGAEGLISAFCHLFEMQAWIVRPANIIGPRATHGVVFDFVRRLKADPTRLRILGDGLQSKAYLHVDDVIDALFLVFKKAKEIVNVFNLSSNSFITVNRIANLVTLEMGLPRVKYTHTPGKIGWKGDVAVIRLSNTRLARLGWRAKYTSVQAVRATVRALLTEGRRS
ncbi:MAG TPA: SDR family NAD(P)-dependent oxidoreductase [Candidatus Limnocylindria bacterium]|nr:SDR family NAD(P)-dependent oxidoreductase [Candidatus Limnocylindria bacterium]